MEVILNEYQNVLGDAVIVFNKIKESIIIKNNKVVKNDDKTMIMAKYLREIGDLKTQPVALQTVSTEALNIYNYYKGNFWLVGENLNLEALQKSPILSNIQEIEAHNIVKDHLEEAINTLEKSHIYALAKDEDRLHYTSPINETTQTNEKKEKSFVDLLTKEKADNNNISTSQRANKRALSPDERELESPNKKSSFYVSKER